MLRGVLDDADMAYLRQACQRHFSHDNCIPSYVLIDELEAPTCRKIKRLIEASLGREIFYLNDFYVYSDSTSQSAWHMDTELFTFASCINAWILLSPKRVESPLAVIGDLNCGGAIDFHSVQFKADTCTFTNFATGKREARALQEIESGKDISPNVSVGDILILNPKRFHKTNTMTPKHAIIFKFLLKGDGGFFSKSQVPGIFWREIAIFNRLVRDAQDWGEVLDGLREQLKTPEGRKALGAGFFPEKIDLYRSMAATL